MEEIFIKKLFHSRLFVGLKLFPIIFVVLTLTACGFFQEKPPSRYSVEKDFSPLLTMDPSTIRDAIPRSDPRTIAGNKNPYTILGKTYTLLPTEIGYKDQGGASWYGLKFQAFSQYPLELDSSQHRPYKPLMQRHLTKLVI